MTFPKFVEADPSSPNKYHVIYYYYNYHGFVLWYWTHFQYYLSNTYILPSQQMQKQNKIYLKYTTDDMRPTIGKFVFLIDFEAMCKRW